MIIQTRQLVTILITSLATTLAQSPFRGISFPELIEPFIQRNYDPLNPSETCFDVLYESDANRDGKLQNSEYTTFIAELSDGDFNETNYIGLPFILKVNFIYLSCLCQFFPDEGATPSGNCCEGPGGIDVSGAGNPNDGIDVASEDDLYLRTVCAETQGAIEYAREEAGITRPPTLSPSAALTLNPTSSPSVAPTPKPSASPIGSPSASPIESPTASPSKEPTSTPSAEPTEIPTEPPSEPPSTRPTRSPLTMAPTGGPTLSPITEDPTAIPTPVPSKSPASDPVTPFPSTPIPVSNEPTTSPSKTSDAPTKSPIVGTGAPAVSPLTQAPIIATGAPAVSPPTLAPIVGIGAPTVSPATEAPIIGTKAPTEAPSDVPTKAPIIGTSAPTTEAPAEAPIISAEAPTVTPSKAPSSGTRNPTVAPSTKDPSDTGIPTVSPSTKASPAISTVTPMTAKPTSAQVTTVPPTNSPGSSGDAPSQTNPSVEKPGSERIPPNSGNNERLTPGQTTAIALVAAFIVSAAGYVYISRRKRDRDDDPELQDVANKDLDHLEAGRALERRAAELAGDDVTPMGGGGGSDSSGSDGTDFAVRPTVSSRGSDAAVYDGEPYDSPHYIHSSSSSTASPRSPPTLSRDILEGVPASPRARNEGTDSSSGVSEGGWSSSAGMSSLNTASFDDRTDDGLLLGSPDQLLAAIGAADTVTQTAGSTRRDDKPSFIPIDDQNVSRSSNGSPTTMSSPLRIHSGRSPPSGKVSREDLNAAIEAGDWAMVGATAALLADSSHSDQSLSAQSSGRSMLSSSSHSAGGSSVNSSVNSSAYRAQELDRMVVRGDWEGVVLAAAQFEGTGSRSRDEDTMGSDSLMTEAQVSRNREEMRAEVEMLVRRVVPDEVENIDEMMLQFEGREDELIETLRTMQERNVAQRARAAVQKTAKLEAKAKATLSGSASASSSIRSTDYGHRNINSGSLTSDEPSHYGSSNAGSSSISDYHDDSSVSDLEMSSHDQDSSRKTTQSSLELAIERGDWRAVGEAAAMMGGPSALVPDFPGDDSVSSGLSESAGRPERVYYLDALIAKGDWAGIVAAAGKYQAMEDRTTDGDGGYPPNEEEREALAQATMWEDIANQSRRVAGGGEETQGALDAADWAISRSLERKMNEAAGAIGSGVSESDAKKSRIMDDESV